MLCGQQQWSTAVVNYLHHLLLLQQKEQTMTQAHIADYFSGKQKSIVMNPAGSKYTTYSIVNHQGYIFKDQY